MKKYTVIIEKTESGYSAYVPDLPGCITVGESIDQIKQHIKEAIELYIEELESEGKNIPEPNTLSEIISV